MKRTRIKSTRHIVIDKKIGALYVNIFFETFDNRDYGPLETISVGVLVKGRKTPEYVHLSRKEAQELAQDLTETLTRIEQIEASKNSDGN